MLNRHGSGYERISVGAADRSGRRGKRRLGAIHGFSYLDRTPILPGTLFGLELLLREAHLDVGQVTELVLDDVGAVIHVLKRTGREDQGMARLPERIAECLVTLDGDDLLNGLSRQSIAPRRKHAAVFAVWEHCRVVARYASIAAESTERIPAGDAYLAGLLDDRGAIAAVLGWPLQIRKRSSAGELLAMAEILPRGVASAFGQAPEFRRPQPWKHILDMARELAGPPVALADLSGARPAD